MKTVVRIYISDDLLNVKKSHRNYSMPIAKLLDLSMSGGYLRSVGICDRKFER